MNMPEYLSKDILSDTVIRDLLSSVEMPENVKSSDPVDFLVGGSRSIAVKKGNYVFRFPLGDEVFQSQKREQLISALLQKKLSLELKNKIPDIHIIDENESCSKYYKRFSYHKNIPGKIMDNIRGETVYNTCYFNLERDQKEKLAEKTALLLIGLHAVPANEIAKINSAFSGKGDCWDGTKQDDFDYDLSRRLILEHSQNRIDLDRFKTKFTDDLCFCHNDLSGSNLLIDKNSADVLNGVIDFGNADVVPRINDFIPFYKISRSLAKNVIEYYNRLSVTGIDIKEVDYKFLTFTGSLLCRQYRQNKRPTDFAMTIIHHFTKEMA